MGRRPALFNRRPGRLSVLHLSPYVPPHPRPHYTRGADCGVESSVDQRGNLPEPEKIAEIQPGDHEGPGGQNTRDAVERRYLRRHELVLHQQGTKQVAFFDPDVLDQQVFVIAFNSKGVVSCVDHKDLKDARHRAGARRHPGPRTRTVLSRSSRQYRPLGQGRAGTGGGSGPSTGGPSPTGGNR